MNNYKVVFGGGEIIMKADSFDQNERGDFIFFGDNGKIVGAVPNYGVYYVAKDEDSKPQDKPVIKPMSFRKSK